MKGAKRLAALLTAMFCLASAAALAQTRTYTLGPLECTFTTFEGELPAELVQALALYGYEGARCLRGAMAVGEFVLSDGTASGGMRRALCVLESGGEQRVVGLCHDVNGRWKRVLDSTAGALSAGCGQGGKQRNVGVLCTDLRPAAGRLGALPDRAEPERSAYRGL